MLSRDIYLDLLVDEYELQRQWLTTVLDEALPGSDSTDEALHSDASASMVCDGALAYGVAALPEELRTRLARRLDTAAFTGDARENERVLYQNTFAMLSTLRAAALAERAGNAQLAPELASSLVLELHQRMGECLWLLESLAGRPEGELAGRAAVRDHDLADRVYAEAAGLNRRA